MREKVKALVIEGLSDREIAAAVSTTRFPVSHQAITSFRKRHAGELAEMTTAIVEGVRQAAIADQHQRILEYQRIYDETDLRRQGVPERAGMVYAALVREQRGVLKDVAEELDQLPRGTTIQDNRVQILVKQVKGFDPELLR